ncbi:MAG: SusC/RagA family TonB-linked outer membrane protein [Gemmatimonas sp.]
MFVGARRLFAAVTFGLLSAQAVHAQGTTGRITGRVLETASQGPLANVSVTLVGNSLGTYTRPDGGYLLTAVPAGAYRLRVARIGYTAKEVPVTVVAGEASTVDVTLDALAAQLAGVVTVGYGTREARDRTGVVETITERTFNTGRVISPEQLIQAKVAGVQVVDNNEPGGGLSIRIRGGTSVNASNEPLFVVDGVPLQIGGGVSAGRNPLNFLNPADIESISVLKDASATAIYGSRGANGVVIVTTKRGTLGTQVTYGTSYSNSVVAKSLQMMDAAAYKAAVQKYAPTQASKLGAASTDWLDAIQRSAAGQEHNLAVSGGKDAMRYRLSLNYLGQDGVLQGTTARRIGSSFNYSDRLFNDQFEVKTSLKASRNDDWFTPGGVLGSATSMAPTQPLRNTDGTFFQWSDPLGANNPLSDLALVQDRGSTFRTIGNFEGKYTIPRVTGLSLTARVGYDFAQSSRTTFSPATAQQDVESTRGGRFDRNNPRQVNTVFETFANYARKLEGYNSDLDVTAGYTYENSQGDYPSFFAQKLSTSLLGLNGVPGAETQGNFLDVQESRLISGFARMNYTLNDKYLLTASIRRDGSSRFGPGQQWGVFPSLAGAWRIIDESFLKDKTPLSDLKLRYSWGVNGNQAFGNYLFVSSYSTSNQQALVQFGNQYINMIRPSAVDPSIKWEQTTSNNVGVDFGLFSDRVTGTVDYYTKDTKDLIFRVAVPAGTNLSNFVTTNIGSLQNKGVEVGVNARLFEARSEGAFAWDANLNFATNTNKVVKITGAGSDAIYVGGIAGGVGNNVQVLKPGYAVNTFLVYKHQIGADGKPVTGDKADKDMYVDQNGDGNINFDDRVPFKSPQPKMIIGHTSNMSWNKVDLSLTARAYLGNYVYNNVSSNLGNFQVLNGNAPANVYAGASEFGFTKPQYWSELYVEKASFLRIDNITLGYTLNKLRSLNTVRVFGTVQNAFTSTKYTGIDPMAGVNGIDNNIYPLSRIFTAGLNIGF